MKIPNSIKCFTTEKVILVDCTPSIITKTFKLYPNMNDLDIGWGFKNKNANNEPPKSSRLVRLKLSEGFFGTRGLDFPGNDTPFII